MNNVKKIWNLSDGETIREADNGYGFYVTQTLDLSRYGEKTEIYLYPSEVAGWMKRNYKKDLHLLREIIPTHWTMPIKK